MTNTRMLRVWSPECLISARLEEWHTWILPSGNYRSTWESWWEPLKIMGTLMGNPYLERHMISDMHLVVLLSHSLGGLWALHFLNQQTISWCQKYVRHYIALSTSWGGTVQQMRTYASGYTEGAVLIDPLVLRAEQRSSESNLWLLPVPEVFGNRTLVTAGKKKYSASDIPEFLEDIGFSEGVPLYNSRIPALTGKLKPPGIPVTLIFSNGIKTPETLVYGENAFDKQPKVVNGDGDGTVNLCSLSAVAEMWDATEGQTVKVIQLEGKTHNTILTDMESVKVMVNEIMDKEALTVPLLDRS